MQVPDSITSWVGEAVGLSPGRGLGIAEPTLLKTFKPFFIDFTLPPYVVRGEQAKIPLSIYMLGRVSPGAALVQNQCFAFQGWGALSSQSRRRW